MRAADAAMAECLAQQAGIFEAVAERLHGRAGAGMPGVPVGASAAAKLLGAVEGGDEIQVADEGPPDLIADPDLRIALVMMRTLLGCTELT